MSDQSQYQQYPGGEQRKPYEPPESNCPDPCDEPPRWGPPRLNDDCCPEHECCEGSKRCCTWEEIDDPCIKAVACAKEGEWAKISCKCQPEYSDCCKEWDCGCYEDEICVPCEPCKGLLPEPPKPDDPGDKPIDCNKPDLNDQLTDLAKHISFQQGEKARLEADIKVQQEREKELRDLNDKLDGIFDTYRTEYHKLICREDCLKGFHRETSKVFSHYNQQCLNDLTATINKVLCHVESVKCCQKNLDGKLTKVTRLVWKQQQANSELEKANKAFAIMKDLPKWMDERFKELETLKDQIAQNLNDKDLQKNRWAFYLFYWKFVPAFCRCFPFPFCCCKPEKPGTASAEERECEPTEHLGCDPGDWHPSKITPDRLKVLICCAWDNARRKKASAQEATEEVEKAKRNLELIKKRAEEEAKNLEKNLKNAIKDVTSCDK